MKKLLLAIMTIILFASCGNKETMSEAQINKVVELIENKNFEALDDYELNEVEFEFGRCYRQCRRTHKINKPPLKIVIGEADITKYKVSGIEYNKQNYTDSDNLYNAYINVVRAHCIDGCSLKQPYADKVSEESRKYNEAFNKLMGAKAKIEEAKQSQKKDEEEKKKEDKSEKVEKKETTE